MAFDMTQLYAVLPEIWVTVMACAILIVAAMQGSAKSSLVYYLAQLTLLGAAALTLYLYNQPASIIFYNEFIHDKPSSLFKLFIYVTAAVSFLYGKHYIKERDIPHGEYYVLGLFTILGGMVLVSAYSFLSLYLGLEILSLPMYALVAIRRDSAIGAEAAIKYFTMGALASGMLLYGLSMFYGVTGSLSIEAVSSAIQQLTLADHPLLVLGLVFTVVGIAFKIGAAPFHLWVPDVYHGAPDSVTLFISGAPKVAALGFAIRLLVGTMPTLSEHWQQMFMVLAVLSMGLGNLVAIVQSNIKRMLAYSAIAHMGYMALGLVAANPDGYAAATFYMINYAIMSVGAFGVITILTHRGFEAENIDDLKGLNARNPWLAFMMLLVMFSMAGIPPTVGFFAKLGVLEALINAGIIWLAAVALLFAIIGAYYYLRVVKVMYFEAPEDADRIHISTDMTAAISINGLVILLLGIFPSALIELCRAAFM